MGKKGSKKRKGTEEEELPLEPEPDEDLDSQDKRKKKKQHTVSPEAQSKKALSVFISNGLKSSNTEANENAVTLRNGYDEVKHDPAMSKKFAEKFMETKSSKNFAWVKEFREQLQADHTVNTKTTENYMTLTRPQLTALHAHSLQVLFYKSWRDLRPCWPQLFDLRPCRPQPEEP